MACLWLGADWPVHDLAEGYLYSAHMVQHLVFTLVAAPLLIAGTPAWMWRDVLPPRWLFLAFRFLTRPIVALILFNGLLLFTHWPEVVEASVRSELAHFTLHVLLFGSAIVVWWPVMSPLVELPALTPPAQMMYLFVQSLAPTIPASFLTFGHTLLYPVYGTFPPDLGHLGAQRPADRRAPDEARRRVSSCGGSSRRSSSGGTPARNATGGTRSRSGTWSVSCDRRCRDESRRCAIVS